MKKNLNLKALANGMRVEDKARLLFADRNKRAETKGKESLLTPEEENALINDAQALNQISELNRLNKLFNIAGLIVLDIQTAYLNFRLAESRLLNVLTGMILVGEGNDALNHAIYDISTQDYTKEQIENDEYREEIDINASRYREKHKISGLSSNYQYFEPFQEESYFYIKNEMLSEPNYLLQEAFMTVISKVKQYRRQVYSLRYIESKARIPLLSDRDIESIKSYTSEVDNFIHLEGYLGLIKMYANFADKGILKSDPLHEPKFLNSIWDMKRATMIGIKSKLRIENELEQALNRYNG